MRELRQLSGRENGASTSDRLAETDLLRLVIDTAIAAVVTMNEDGTISGWGARAEETFGWTRSEALGTVLVDLIVPERYREAHNRGLDHFRRTGEGPVLGRVLELSALHRDGREFPIELRIAPAAQLEGAAIFIAFVLDISERSAAREELERVNRELQAAKQATEDFVQMMVHELRQPLSVARGYVDLTMDLVEDQAERQLRIIERKLGDAAALVDDVLLAARLSAGRHVTTTGPVELAALVRDVVANAVPSASLRDGDIAVITPTNDVMVMLEAASTIRILNNLLTNAILYSREAPRIRVVVESDGSVLVADNGKGVPSEMRERIFDRFVRVEDRTATPGTGLGLYISRQLAELQGGTLALERSELGEGSTFRLTFLST